jgi:hypothetical protein
MSTTEDEIRAHARGVLTLDEVRAHPEAATLAALHADPRFPALCATFQAGEGNLLEATEADTAVQQIATIRWAIDAYAPVILSSAEVGFHKGFFYLLLTHLRPLIAFDHFACDIRPESATAAAVLGPRVHFTAGVSRLVWADVLEQVGGVADLAWVDGGHEGSILAHDLSMAMEYGARLILVDDAVWLPKLAGVIQDCCNVYGYVRVTPPTPEDRRGIAVLVRK